MPEPLLTVLMPVYNAEKYLRIAIDSILNQSFREFEFMIIDDGSSDQSISIIESYNDPRIRLIKNEKNLGITATLNKGIQLSNTELIARMDADDISYPERLQKQYEYLSKHQECALVSSWAREITQDGEPSATMEFDPDYYHYMLNFECWIYHPAVMYRRSAVQEVGMYTVRYSEDFELWWQLSRRYKIYVFPEVLLDYRLSDNSQSRITKFKETDDIQHAQVLRNIRYYTGEHFSISPNEIEFLRFNLTPILQENRTGSLVKAFRKLNAIGQGFEQKDKIYQQETQASAAVVFQKKRLVKALKKELSFLQLFSVLIRTGYYRLFLK